MKIFTIISDCIFVCVVVIDPMLDCIGMIRNIFKMLCDIVSAHYKTKITDLVLVTLRKIIFPIKRDVAAFDNQILLVFNRCFYNFPYNIPKIWRQFFIFAWSQLCLTASNQPHFKMVNRKVWKLNLLKQALRQKRFARMGSTGN